jgi:hypothetical protein
VCSKVVRPLFFVVILTYWQKKKFIFSLQLGKERGSGERQRWRGCSLKTFYEHFLIGNFSLEIVENPIESIALPRTLKIWAIVTEDMTQKLLTILNEKINFPSLIIYIYIYIYI